MLTALTPAPARRTHHPLDQHGQQTARQHPVHLRERLPRRHGHPRLPAQGGTAASPGTAHLPCPPRPAPHAAAGQPRPRPADRRFLGQEVPPGSIHLRMQSGLLLETTFGEDKTTITGAGNRTSGPVLRSGSPRLVIQEAWAWLTATQLVRASEAAALRTGAAAARALRREDSAPVTADEESFTAVWRHAIRSMTSSQLTATSSLDALAAAADAAARAALRALNVPARERHSKRAQKARPKFAHASSTKETVTGKPQVTVFAPGFS